MWLTGTSTPLSWDATVQVGQIAYNARMPSGSVTALAGPAQFAEGKRRILLEAESSFAQRRGQAKPYTHRAFLSNGIGLGSWTELRHELSWALDAPASGTYALVLKGAVWDAAGARRALAVDGRDLNNSVPVLFACTDGFGATSAEWRHFTVAGPDGQALPLELTAGRHTLTMVNYANGLNLDYLALVPLDE